MAARIAGALYFVAVATAVFGEFFARGKLGLAAIIIPVACYIAVTLLVYRIFRPVNDRLAFVAACFGILGLAFEALDLQPRGLNVAVILHGFYCLLIGYLIFESTFLPRILGAPMAFAGVIWLIYLSPPAAAYLSPYNTLAGLIGEGLPMLWLLVMGVNVARWNERAAALRSR